MDIMVTSCRHHLRTSEIFKLIATIISSFISLHNKSSTCKLTGKCISANFDTSHRQFTSNPLELSGDVRIDRFHYILNIDSLPILID